MTEINTFDIEVVTQHDPRTFVIELFKHIDVDVDIEHIDGITQMQTDHFAVSAFDEAQDMIPVELGIQPNVFIQFRPKQNLQTDVLAIKNLLEAIDYWIKRINNDFALVYNGETVMMYRKGNQLYVNTASAGWTDARRSIITTAYKEVHIPALDETD